MITDHTKHRHAIIILPDTIFTVSCDAMRLLWIWYIHTLHFGCLTGFQTHQMTHQLIHENERAIRRKGKKIKVPRLARFDPVKNQVTKSTWGRKFRCRIKSILIHAIFGHLCPVGVWCCQKRVIVTISTYHSIEYSVFFVMAWNGWWLW